MSILLYCLGAICFVAGLVAAGFGVPVSEFSFGNTLIVAGATLAAGGLIVFSLGAVVARLQQILDLGSLQATAQPQRALESFESAMPHAPAGRVPFPPRPKMVTSEPVGPATEPSEAPAAVPVAAPTLPNPDEPPVTVAETVSLTPSQSTEEAADLSAGKEEPTSPQGPESAFEREWPAPEPVRERRSFGFKWPERKVEKPAPEQPAEEPIGSAPPEPEPEAPAPEPSPAAVAAPEFVPPSERPRDVAILKSGVVDGMGYTLYVDGSIEAELPQGTLRFASINELRQHLEQNT